MQKVISGRIFNKVKFVSFNRHFLFVFAYSAQESKMVETRGSQDTFLSIGSIVKVPICSEMSKKFVETKGQFHNW